MSELSYTLETVSLAGGDCSCQQELRLKNEVIENLQAEVERMRRQINNMILGKEQQQDEIRALKVEARSYLTELETSGSKAQEIEKIGKEVRMRFLECHRRRMGKPIGGATYAHIKSG